MQGNERNSPIPVPRSSATSQRSPAGIAAGFLPDPYGQRASPGPGSTVGVKMMVMAVAVSPQSTWQGSHVTSSSSIPGLLVGLFLVLSHGGQKCGSKKKETSRLPSLHSMDSVSYCCRVWNVQVIFWWNLLVIGYRYLMGLCIRRRNPLY